MEIDMAIDLGNLLQQYMGGSGNAHQAEGDFDQVAQNAPRSAVAQGVTQAMRSDQTPPFPQMVGQMFNHGDPDQRAGMLNQLISGAGPALLSSVAGGALGSLFRGKDAPAKVTPEQAATMTPQQVQQIAEQAEQQNPGVVERMGDFYAEHPTLVKSLGGAALAIALGHMAQGMRR
jgi:hypothetical protein